jgi:hypothetical protein
MSYQSQFFGEQHNIVREWNFLWGKNILDGQHCPEIRYI